jgi:SAM-dependent methyltransferase
VDHKERCAIVTTSTPSAPALDALRQAVEVRYAALSTSCCSLSCGAALDLAAVEEGEVFVDLGCGRGQDVLRAAGRVGDDGQAIGVDQNEAMIAQAQKAVPPFLTNVRFVRSDLQALDVADELAHVVISNCTINHAPDKQAVYQEIWRILKPGGRFVVSDVIADTELPQEVRRDPAAWAACYGGAIPEDAYLAAVAGGGFELVQVLERSDPYEKGGVLVRSLTLKGVKS